MGILDPFWNAVDTTIAGAGATVGGAIQGIGDGITQTGRAVGDSIAGAASGYGNYVNDSANYVRDATGAPGVRAGSASNPLGLTRNKEAAKMTGMPKYSGAVNKGAVGQKPSTPAPPKTIAPSEKQRSLASTNAANIARAQAAKRREAAASGQSKTGTVTGKPAAKPAAKPPTASAPAGAAKKSTPKTSPAAAAAAAKKPTPKPSTGAAQAQKKPTVTGRPAAKPAAEGVKK